MQSSSRAQTVTHHKLSDIHIHITDLGSFGYIILHRKIAVLIILIQH